ncbi:alpha/beta hydrolase [Acetobacter orleanensis]|nr:alpha/beta hydrolase [Acetobacter orleanensis]PCD79874.1 alpha/beta hydrolase [Acetobacter orleanensis]
MRYAGVMRVLAEPERAQGVPACPNLSSRLLLAWIRWQARRRNARTPQNPVPMVESLVPESLRDENAAQAAFLAALRKAMDTPSFPTRLSSLGIRKVLSLSVPGAAGSMQARLYLPYGRVRGAVLYLHGGGFVHCGLNSHHGLCCRLARVSGAAVLLPDYRLAPEHPYPAAADDALCALRWLADLSARLWGGKVAVAGDSAGGNLSAVLAQDGAAGHGPVPALQLLYYPSLYGAQVFPSHELYAEGYFLSRASMQWYGDQYIAREEDWAAPRFVPGLKPDLSGLAPAVIVTAECDPMRDEGAAYAEALRQAGVPVQYKCYRGALHGFLNFYALMPNGKAALRLGGRALRKAFAR